MDHPYYTATVENTTQGWTLTAVEGEEADTDLDVQLTSPLTYTWAFSQDLLPGQLDPMAATFNLASRTADAVPALQVGDLVTLDVRVGTSGPRIIDTYAMRITAVVHTVAGRGNYRIRTQVSLTDLSVDWTGLAVGAVYSDPAYSREHWREAFAEVANRIGLTIGCPTSWADNEAPRGQPSITDLDGFEEGLYQYRDAWPNAAQETLNRLLNSHHPDGDTHTWVTVYAASHPAGYRRIGPNTFGSIGTIPEPTTTLKIEAVPASTRAAAAAGWPLTLELGDDSVIHVIPVEPPSTDAMAQLGLDADWCILPAQIRTARDSGYNTIQIDGLTDEFHTDSSSWEFAKPFVRQYQQTADVAARGVIVRQVPTQLKTSLGASPDYAEPAIIAPDYYATGTDRAYDQFTLIASKVPQDVAEWLLPLIAPRLPGETDGDGRLVRQVTVFDLDPDLRFHGEPSSGFIVAGTMTIQGGDISWSLSEVPGTPQWTDHEPDHITVGDMISAFGTVPAGNVDPLITVADLAYVGM